jgi:hypothetical protein
MTMPSKNDVRTHGTLSQSLLMERNILHLLLYRYKNQHRRSIWFKWLRMFKRSVERLIYESPETPKPKSTVKANLQVQTHSQAVALQGGKASTSGKSSKKASQPVRQQPKQQIEDDIPSNQLVEGVLRQLRDKIIPGCYTAFTHLITSTQYAGLGMTMLSCLARVYANLKARMQDDSAVGVALERLPKQPLKDELENKMTDIDEEDLGVVIDRAEFERQMMGLKR